MAHQHTKSRVQSDAHHNMIEQRSEATALHNISVRLVTSSVHREFSRQENRHDRVVRGVDNYSGNVCCIVKAELFEAERTLLAKKELTAQLKDE